ncbi:hypothetical protein TNCV_3890161 [Trichonephila clavipes]|nr:hypothetical protein TNCV_3890161 [Trichonephila clavipes]
MTSPIQLASKLQQTPPSPLAGDERRALDGENLKKKPWKKETWTVEYRDWSRKRGVTLNAGGIEEPETMNVVGVGALESMV